MRESAHPERRSGTACTRAARAGRDRALLARPMAGDASRAGSCCDLRELIELAESERDRALVEVLHDALDVADPPGAGAAAGPRGVGDTRAAAPGEREDTTVTVSRAPTQRDPAGPGQTAPTGRMTRGRNLSKWIHLSKWIRPRPRRRNSTGTSGESPAPAAGPS